MAAACLTGTRIGVGDIWFNAASCIFQSPSFNKRLGRDDDLARHWRGRGAVLAPIFHDPTPFGDQLCEVVGFSGLVAARAAEWIHEDSTRVAHRHLDGIGMILHLLVGPRAERAAEAVHGKTAATDRL